MKHVIEEGYKDKMIQIINSKNFDVDKFTNLDLSENIIISTSEVDNKYIKEHLDGSLSIMLDREINLMGEKIYNSNNLVSIKYTPRIKIACPRGVILEFGEPVNINYFYKIYKSYKTYQYFQTEEETILQSSNPPNVIIYQEFDIEIVTDLKKLKQVKTIFKLSKGESILRFIFKYIYFPGVKQQIPKIKNIYWFQHNEIYKEFLKNI